MWYYGASVLKLGLTRRLFDRRQDAGDWFTESTDNKFKTCT